MKQSVRTEIKNRAGITESKTQALQCRRCLYHNREKICQIHSIKTRVDETCPSFASQRKHPIYLGGGVSPR